MRRAAAMSIGFSSGSLPGQLDQPVEIVADHAIFGGGLGRALQAADLLLGLLLDFLRHAGLGDRLGQLRDLVGLAVLLAELALDRGHLLAQHRLALALVERGPRLLADLGGNAAAPRCAPRAARRPGRSARRRRWSRELPASPPASCPDRRRPDRPARRARLAACTVASSSAGVCGRSCSASTAMRCKLR